VEKGDVDYAVLVHIRMDFGALRQGRERGLVISNKLAKMG
jgi:hypothetical protein